jgi:hypothetical protein
MRCSAPGPLLCDFLLSTFPLSRIAIQLLLVAWCFVLGATH